MKYDIAIIGGGPAGYTAAERAAANGLRTVLFEKKAIGGVCLNEGCIPTKTLLYSAKLWDNMKGASKYGISVPDGSSFDMKKIIDRKDKIVKKADRWCEDDGQFVWCCYCAAGSRYCRGGGRTFPAFGCRRSI